MRHVAAFLDAGHTAEVIVQNDLPHVDAAAIHEAIAYYFDHRTEIEAELTANTPEAVSQQFQQRLTPPPYTQRNHLPEVRLFTLENGSFRQPKSLTSPEELNAYILNSQIVNRKSKIVNAILRFVFF